MVLIRAVMLGKLGVGKSTLINKFLGVEKALTSDGVDKGCTVGVCSYAGENNGRNYKLWDTEGTFGARDNVGQVIKTIAEGLNGEPVHAMLCCISIQHTTRVDLDTMKALQMCAGIVGELNVDKVVVVFTFANTDEQRKRADDSFVTIKDCITEAMKGSSDTKMQRMKPLADLVAKDLLKCVKVSLDSVSELESLLDEASAKEPAAIKPEEWTKNEDEAEDFLNEFLKNIFLPIMKTIVEIAASAAGTAASSAARAFLPF